MGGLILFADGALGSLLCLACVVGVVVDHHPICIGS